MRTYLRALRKGWWLILALALLGLAAGYGVNAKATPKYASKLTFFVGTARSSGSASALTDDQFAQRRVNSYVELLSSGQFGDIVAQANPDLGVSPASEITGTAELNTVLLKVQVTDTSRNRARTIAQAVADLFPGYVNKLEGQGQTTTQVSLTPVSGPTSVSKPVSPRTTVNLGIGLVVGLLLGLIAAVIRELLDNTVRSEESLRAISTAPVVGSMFLSPTAKKSPLIVAGEAHSVRAEAFRQLRTNLQFVDVDHPAKVIVVTSALPGEGKSTTAANLAVVFAENSQRVLLVEADMRRPQIADYLGLERAIGLSDVLAGHVQLHEVIQQWGASVSVLTCGSLPPNPSELLGSRHMESLLQVMRLEYDLIIFDTPPLLPVTDAAVLSTQADGTVVVVRTGSTTRAQLSTAVRSLTSVDSTILGFVTITKKPRSRRNRAAYDSYYGSQPAPVSDPMAGLTAGDAVADPELTPQHAGVNHRP